MRITVLYVVIRKIVTRTERIGHPLLQRCLCPVSVGTTHCREGIFARSVCFTEKILEHFDSKSRTLYAGIIQNMTSSYKTGTACLVARFTVGVAGTGRGKERVVILAKLIAVPEVIYLPVPLAFHHLIKALLDKRFHVVLLDYSESAFCSACEIAFARYSNGSRSDIHYV